MAKRAQTLSEDLAMGQRHNRPMGASNNAGAKMPSGQVFDVMVQMRAPVAPATVQVVQRDAGSAIGFHYPGATSHLFRAGFLRSRAGAACW